MRASPLIVLLVPLIGGGCTSPPSGWAGTVTDSAGVEIVSNPAQGMWRDGEGWTVREELKIGALEGDPAYQFGQVGARGIALGTDQRIYVLDAMAREIRVFSPTGSHERTIGKPGSGPGEIGVGANFLLLSRGDTLLVPDVGNRRVTWYASHGNDFGSTPLAIASGIPMTFTSTSVGVVVGQIRPVAFPGQPVSGDGRDVIVVVTAEGVAVDTLLRFGSGQTFSFAGDRPELKIFSAEPTWTVTDGLQVVYGVNDDYRIGVYGTDGALERVITKPFERGAVGAADRELVMDFLVKTWREAGVPPADRTGTQHRHLR